MDDKNTPSAVTPDQAFKKLDALNDGVRRRYEQVAQSFKGSPIDPIQRPDFRKFIMDHLAMVNSWYVVTGQFLDFTMQGSESDPTAKNEAKLKEHGFFVSRGDGSKVALDPMLIGNPAVADAALDGAFDEEDESKAPIIGPNNGKD